MLFYLISSISLILFLLHVVIKCYQKLYFGDALKIPGPPAVLLLGNIFDMGFNTKEVFVKFVNMKRKYGSLFGLWLTSFSYRVVLSDPVLAERILLSSKHLEKGSGYFSFDPLLGNGLINSELTLWKQNRKILLHTFNVQLLKEFVDVFNTISNVFIDIMKEKSIDGHIDIQKLTGPYTLDAVCKTMMGISINAQKDENKEFSDAVDEHLEIAIMKLFSLPRRINLYYRLTRNYKREKESLKIIKDYVRSIIRHRELLRMVERQENNKREKCDDKKRIAFLDLLLDLKDDGVYTEQDVLDHTITFLIAGQHTTASALSFALYELSKHPDVQSRIVEEVQSVVGSNNNENITFEDIQKLQYTECAIKECLRMYPPLIFFERSLNEDVVMDGYRLPKNTNILFNVYGTHHDEKLYPDPEKFDPDRFSIERCNQSMCAFLPFSIGPRNCIGMPYAMCQLKVSLANILRKLEIKRVPFEHKPSLYTDVVLKSSNGLPINVKVR